MLYKSFDPATLLGESVVLFASELSCASLCWIWLVVPHLWECWWTGMTRQSWPIATVHLVQPILKFSRGCWCYPRGLRGKWWTWSTLSGHTNITLVTLVHTVVLCMYTVWYVRGCLVTVQLVTLLTLFAHLHSHFALLQENACDYCTPAIYFMTLHGLNAVSMGQADKALPEILTLLYTSCLVHSSFVLPCQHNSPPTLGPMALNLS